MDDIKDRIRLLHVRFTAALAFLVTVGYFSAIASLMLLKVPDDSHEVLLVMLGTLGTAWGGIIGYFFGSSAGSAQKDIVQRPMPPSFQPEQDKPREPQS